MALPRLLTGSKVLTRLKKIEKFYIPQTSPVNDTLAAAIVTDDTDVEVTTFSSFATGDFVIANGGGGMELNQLGTKPGSAAPIPVVRPWHLAQPLAGKISKATRVDLGYIEESSAQIGATSSTSPVGAANSQVSIATIDGDVADPALTFAIRESDLRNILFAFGVDEDQIKGTTVGGADPFRAFINASNIGSQSNFCLRLSGLLADGSTQYLDVMDCRQELAVAHAFGAKGNPGVWNISVKFRGLLPWLG